MTSPSPRRAEELRRLLPLTADELVKRAEGRLTVLPDIDALHRHMADALFEEIRANNEAGRPTRLILPVGPVGQYPPFVERANAERLDLGRCHFFFMDEYLDNETGRALTADHPLGFKGTARRLFLDRLDPDLAPPEEQVVFPDERNVGELAARIDALGGIDSCYGGVGIHGHVAFNEPAPGVADSDPRVVELNDFTITINAVRAEVGGNLEGFPRRAATLGLRQVLGAKRVKLYIRNGVSYDWANAVLRLALFGEPGEDYPVTLLRGRSYTIVTDENTARSPKIVL